VRVLECVRASKSTKVLAKEGFDEGELKSGRGKPRRAEPNSRFYTVLSPNSGRRRRDVRSLATRRRGAATNEVSRAAARSVTKERNIARRDITVATLLSAYRHAATSGPFTEGNDVAARLPRRDSQKRRSPPAPLLAPSRSSKNRHRQSRTWNPAALASSPLRVLSPSRSRPSREQTSNFHGGLSEAIDTRVADAPRRATPHRAAPAPVKACVLRGKGLFHQLRRRRATTWGTTPRSDAPKKISRIARTFSSHHPFLLPYLPLHCQWSRSFSVKDGAKKGTRFGAGREGETR